MKSIEERIAEKTIPVPECGCWLWEGASSGRYGNIHIKDKTFLVHRIVWELHNGSIPEGMCVCHTCDTPSCVNPRHLFLGTHKANMQDRENKGRGYIPYVRGEKHGRCKLTTKQVLAIREDKRSQKEIAKNYDVCQMTISNIKCRRKWNHL